MEHLTTARTSGASPRPGTRTLARTLVGLALAAGLAAGCSSTGTGAATDSTAGADAAQTAASAVRHLEPAAFAGVIAEPGTVLLDVRTPAEFTAGHLSGAVNLDMQSAGFIARLERLDTSASYALYCRSGHRSAVAAEQMRAAGFGQVVDLAGGITAWMAAGRGVTTG